MERGAVAAVYSSLSSPSDSTANLSPSTTYATVSVERLRLIQATSHHFDIRRGVAVCSSNRRASAVRVRPRQRDSLTVRK